MSPLTLEIGKVYKETKMFLDGEKEEEWTFEVKKIFSLVISGLNSLLLHCIFVACLFGFFLIAALPLSPVEPH